MNIFSQIKQWRLLGLLFCMLVFSFCACKKQKNELLGKWKLITDKSEINLNNRYIALDSAINFNNNGKITSLWFCEDNLVLYSQNKEINGHGDNAIRGGTSNYSYKHNILKMDFLEVFRNKKVETIEFNYKILGDTLVISGEKEFQLYPETSIPDKYKNDSIIIHCFKTTMYFIKQKEANNSIQN